MVETVFDLANKLGGIWFWYFFFVILIGVWSNSKNRNPWKWMVAALLFSPLLIGLVLLFSGKIERIEKKETKSKKEKIKEEKNVIEKEPEYNCNYCNKKVKSLDDLNKHYETCEKKKHNDEKENKILMWSIGIIFFIGFGIYFLIKNKINLIPLLLIGFILTPFFDKFFNHHKKRISNLRHFEINWWKKSIVILIIFLIFFIINLAIPKCPITCNDNNLCTNDFCSKETGYKCMNTLKLNCKGNEICETGEYGTSDCPNCDDNNKCTADSYDLGTKKCINIEMKGCIT